MQTVIFSRTINKWVKVYMHTSLYKIQWNVLWNKFCIIILLLPVLHIIILLLPVLREHLICLGLLSAVIWFDLVSRSDRPVHVRFMAD